jgi:transposase
VDVVEAERRMRASAEPIERSHWQVVWLAMRGKGSPEIVDTTGYGRDWVFKIIQRYNVDGPAGLGDARASNGAAPMLDHEALYELATALEGEPPGGGLWNSPKVAAWMSDKLGRPVSTQRGWEYLRKLGYKLKVPRPRHAGASAEEQEAFKRGASPPRSSGSDESTPMRVWKPGRTTKLGSG